MKRIMFVFLLFVASNCMAGTWTRVNGCGAEVTNTNTQNCVVTGTSVGDFMFVGADCNVVGTQTVAIDDTANTFNVLTGGTNGITSSNDHSWTYTSVLTSGGSRTVTVTFTGNTCNFNDLWVDVFHNTNGVSTINTAATATGTDQSPTVNITSVGSNDLVVAFIGTSGVTIAAGTNYTLGANGNASSVAMGNEYRLGVTAGSQTVNGTLTGSTNWAIHAVSIKEVIGGAAYMPPRIM
jgi:hypothetical protein